MTPKLMVFQSRKKAPNLWKKIFSKKNPSSLFVRIRAKTVCRNFCEINRSPDIKLSVYLRFQKIVPLHKIINKTRLTKKQQNSAHCFGDNYLTDHLVKFQQDRVKP